MRRMRIGTVVMSVVVVALDLTLLRETPNLSNLLLFVPWLAILIVSLNLVAVQILVLRKPLNTFYLGFIAAGLMYGIATFGLRTRILQTLIARYRLLTGDTTIWWFDGNNQLMFAEQGMILILGLLSCLAGGVLAYHLRNRLRPRSLIEPIRTLFPPKG